MIPYELKNQSQVRHFQAPPNYFHCPPFHLH
jgi:hypothetical protein